MGDIHGFTDKLWTANSKGLLKEWSISEQRVYKDWGQIHNGRIVEIRVTPDGGTMLTADETGVLKQWSVVTKRLVWDYGKVHSGFISC
jgi:WD40 repeat protein